MAYFDVKTAEEQGQSLINYLPNGRVFAGKNVDGTNIRAYFLALGQEILRAETNLNTLACEFFPQDTTLFIEEWEALVGIPDDCFTNTGDIETRRNNVLLKLASLAAITEQDWIDLAAKLGFNICIESASKCSIYPLCYPLTYYATAKIARFTAIVYIQGDDPFIYPLDYPLQYSSSVSNILICLLNKIKPANLILIFKFVEDLPC